MRSFRPIQPLIVLLLLAGVAQADQLVAEITLIDRGPREVTLSAEGVLPTVVTFDGWTNSAKVPLVLLDASAEPKFDVPGASIKVARESGDASRPAIGPDLISAILGEDVYSPTFGWRPGADAMLRFRSMLGAALIAMALLAATLLRGRYAVLIVIGVALASVGAIALWWRAQPGVLEISGSIVVKRLDGTVQRDRWRFFTTRHASAAIEIPLTKDALPIFVDAAHAQRVSATILVDPMKGVRTLVATLTQGQCVALVERNAQSDARGDAEMTQLARRMYASPRDVVRESRRGETSLEEVREP